MLYLARTTPKGMGGSALPQFDTAVRSAFVQVTGLEFSDARWQQAALQAGSGARALPSCCKWSPPPRLTLISPGMSLSLRWRLALEWTWWTGTWLAASARCRWTPKADVRCHAWLGATPSRCTTHCVTACMTTETSAVCGPQ